MTVGLTKTIKNCVSEQIKMGIKCFGFGILYVAFMTVMLRDDGQSFRESLGSSFNYFIFVFIAFSMTYQLNYLRTSASVMLMLGDTRKNVSIGRHFCTVMYLVEGMLVSCVPFLIYTNGEYDISKVITTGLSIIMVSGVGMISGLLVHKFGPKAQLAMTLIIVVTVAVVLAIFFGIEGVGFNISTAILVILGMLAGIFYIAGSIVSHFYIKSMEVRP